MQVKLTMAPLFLTILVSAFLLPISLSTSSSVSFPLTHRDAESSLLRTPEADPSDLPEEMPMREFVAAGRAMRERLSKRRGGKASAARPVVAGSFTYLEEAVGEFYLSISVGTPPQKLLLILDTGSELVWTQCKPCNVCSTANGPTFSFHKSSSFYTVPCRSPLCTHSLGFSASCDNSTGTCNFQVVYGDGSTDAGFLSIDSFHFERGFSKPLVFGCSVNSQNTNPGIMGLSAGPFSFTSQLLGSNPRLSHKFAYCLPDRFKNLNSRGTIQFGNYKLPVKLNYTPLVPPAGPLGDKYYYVKLEGITVGKRFIRAEMAGKVPLDEGTVFDSGTVVTHLTRLLYVKMIGEMRKQTAALNPFEAKDPPGGLCYKVSMKNAAELPQVPRITMHFAGKVGLELGPESILYAASSDLRDITVCTAFASALPGIPFNIIGNYQQQNHWVEYNLQTSSIGLARASCVP